ncbi:MAG TPA: N,N-dimethylformamidase beta subunit family domain-containing protein [Kribbella sp.]
MPRILGYVSQLSVAPGDEQTVMVSCAAPEFTAELVRIEGPDTDFGTGPWFRTVPVGEPTLTAPGRIQPTVIGSYATVAHLPLGDDPAGITLHSWVSPTLPGGGRAQTLVSQQASEMGMRLMIDPTGRPSLRVWSADREDVVTLPEPLATGKWQALAAVVDLHRRTLRLWQQDGGMVEQPLTADGLDLSGPLTLAARLDGESPSELYDGKLSLPSVHAQPLGEAELEALTAGHGADGALVARWDFAARPSSTELIDISGNERHGELRNLPTLSVTGPCWTGDHLDPRTAPNQYSAAHFHSDDLADAGWEPSVQLTVPADLPSGLYGVRLSDGSAEDIVPFWVRRASTATPAGVLFLAPTFTYLAYANDRQHVTADFGPVKRTVEFGEADTWLHKHDELGASLYDLHRDGSGFSTSTRRRPILNMRPGYVSWLTGYPRHFSSDLAILGWLDRQDTEYDVATDEDLHAMGASVFEGQQVVVTGTHPEYYSGPMLEALAEYVEGGGRLMYLGGNGFYWVTGVAVDSPHVIEVRRGNAATRTWESQPGEGHLAGTGEPGGLWRHRGRPPNQLVGVGFAGMGWGPGCGYQIADGIPDAIRELIFGEPGPGRVFGEYGWLGGAAGDEVDRADLAQGTPPETLVLASSVGLDDTYQPVVEEQLSILPGLGGSTNPDVRSDVTYTPVGRNGGAVFAAGSVNWGGALPHDQYDNTVASVTTNVLRAFLDGAL